MRCEGIYLRDVCGRPACRLLLRLVHALSLAICQVLL